MMSDCNFGTINFYVQEYRKKFLKRKNVNGYKKTHSQTPILIDKLINTFDRKIKNLPILNNQKKTEYYKGLQYIFDLYYHETFQPKSSKHDAYVKYLVEDYCLYGKKYKSKTFKEFVKSGLTNNYRDRQIYITNI